MDLKTYLEDWDGKSTDYLLALYNAPVEAQQAFIQKLIEFTVDGSLQGASTWLLKHHLEQKRQLTPQQKITLLDSFNSQEEWEAQLHLLQMLPMLSLEVQDFEQILPFTDRCLNSENKFVRAWAYGALGLAAKYLPELLPEIKQRFELAQEEESASVKARIRRTIKENKLPF